MHTRRLPIVSLLTAVLVALIAGDAFAERIRCSSQDYRYAFCGVRQRIVLGASRQTTLEAPVQSVPDVGLAARRHLGRRWV